MLSTFETIKPTILNDILDPDIHCIKDEKSFREEFKKLDTEALLVRAEQLRKPFEGFPYCTIKAGRPLR